MFGITSLSDMDDWEDERVLMASRAQPWLFSVIVDRYQEPFLRKARGIVRNPLDAEEIVQDAFTKIYVYADKYEPQSGAKFSSWAYRILMNTAFTRYQKLIKEGQRFTSIDPDFEQFIGERKEHTGFEEKRDGVERILARLPEHFSYVLRLHYLERWSQEDIATETGENVGTIKARIHRAKEAFRRESRDGEAEALL
ncbi:MAG: RNA polymerase sigma factor [Candidatus Pacebacteria bacterium]|nr:RNA polymerase sigma factor [Candidatus Paceibacterota bacterium]MBP9843148.1 RNA polymerase sigma factor [Candidatus Paceibacterota bacterium]